MDLPAWRAEFRDLGAHGQHDGAPQHAHAAPDQSGVADELLGVGSKVIAIKNCHNVARHSIRRIEHLWVQLERGVVQALALEDLAVVARMQRRDWRLHPRPPLVPGVILPVPHGHLRASLQEPQTWL
eukprot:3357729-Pyramimonas_sp.AAC.1